MSIAPHWRSFVPVALLAGVALLMLGGCATAVRGTTQRVSVITEPPGAECLLKTRPMETAARIAVTPGEIEVRRDGWPLTLSCRRPDFIDHNEEVEAVEAARVDDESKRRMMTGSTVATSTFVAGATGLGITAATTGAGVGAAVAVLPVLAAVVVLAPVSVMVDAFSGAFYGYPTVIAVQLTPASFQNEEARARYAVEVQARLDRSAKILWADTEATCRWGYCSKLHEEDDAYIAQQRKIFMAALAKTRIESSPAAFAAPAPGTAGVPLTGATVAPPP